jgi:hypothetical protein
LAVERDNPAGSGKEWTLHVYNAGGGNGYTLHVHTAGGGKGYTLHVHIAGCGKGYTLYSTSILLAGKGIHPAHTFCWHCKGIII